MVNVLIETQNLSFRTDLENQISRFVSDAHIVTASPDLIIIDEDRIKIKELRALYPCVPQICLLTDNEMASNKLNIFLKKPIRLMKLLDVIRAANNQLDNSEEGCLTFNDYRLHPNKREIEDLLTGQISKLTEKEVSIIKYLYKNPHSFVSKNDLQTNVWQYNEAVATHTIETHIYRLRQKVEKNKNHRLIITDNGGYQLKMDEDA